MAKNIRAAIDSAAKLSKDFLDRNSKKMQELEKEAYSLSDACDQINKSWSGSTIGRHGAYYYRDLTPPPQGHRWSTEWGTIHGVPVGWSERDPDEIKEALEKKVGGNFKIEQFSEKGEKLLEETKKLKTDIEVEFSDFVFTPEMEKEEKLFCQIEGYDFGDIGQLRVDYINPRIKGRTMTRDMAAMAEGTYIPSHMTTKSGTYATERILESIKEFTGLVDRLARQLEKKLSSSASTTLMPSSDPMPKLEKLLKRFHIVAQQLLERRENRNTLIIGDEYDVQDLLHALLKIEFDDIRSEDWTPQYAGSASRMDFLLKKEEVVIEVKKTNLNLMDKQLGEQLILDIAHYKAHQNCKKLICFIYDPRSLIKNRAGLIADLQRSHDGLEVVIIIQP